jgi:hypothetical protein
MKLSDVRSSLKRNNLVFATYKKLTDNEFRSNYIDYLISPKVKDRSIVRKELDLIRQYWKCSPMFYYNYRLFEKELTKEELLDYIPPYYFYNFYMTSMYQGQIKEVADSKLKLDSYFNSHRIETARKIAIAENGILLNSAGEKIGYKELLSILNKEQQGIFFMKPDNGRGGSGIFRIERIGTEFFMNDELIDEKRFLNLIKHKDYIIQENVIQRKDFMECYPNSLNTIRIMTQNRNNKLKMCTATLRMGRNGLFVDNTCAGGIFVAVDINSGAFAKYGGVIGVRQRFEKHPDTGLVFDGHYIKDWQAIKREVLKMAGKATEFPDIGWDIAVTENKIIAIELNVNYGIDPIQNCYGGLRRKLDIDPYSISGSGSTFNFAHKNNLTI